MGREPVLEWLRGLGQEDRRAIGRDLMRVQFGWPVGMPLVRSLEGWPLGSPLSPAEPENCAADALFSREQDCRTAWVYQEVAEDAH